MIGKILVFLIITCSIIYSQTLEKKLPTETNTWELATNSTTNIVSLCGWASGPTLNKDGKCEFSFSIYLQKNMTCIFLDRKLDEPYKILCTWPPIKTDK